MHKITGYEVVFVNLSDDIRYRDENENAFKQHIQSLIKSGYQPYGNPVASNGIYFQAFVKVRNVPEKNINISHSQKGSTNE